MGLSHFDKSGNAVMVDISGKAQTQRIAQATGKIYVGNEIMTHIKEQAIGKGDVLGVARIAGIMAVKRTPDIVPLCHSIPISRAEIDFELLTDNAIAATCTVKTEGKTGAEMEALHGVSIALLTIYDMCKAVDKNMHLEEIHLVKKTGGKSGTFEYAKKD
ncbi:cyclic pyranopterin monophosphate synthase MoaC [[Clostridium] polysaccharolyticum]|uniref:Cyclic pyranopterin monophosphate synthase n=1 Tax=[Clostridium] polysaccharolyticum TaxID=29364 RepID=A0A1I0EEV1_9FIRM|nr:cyclic pyranopterin monophosphate synthase MoaC [[Clostridium] polysaccharolyticum]SET43653.1 cyclic pyranopterin phosphate synthase [[Clostridium] polysaccharolyticum]